MPEEETSPETPDEARARQLADADAEAEANQNKPDEEDAQKRAEKLGDEIFNPEDAEKDLGGDEPRGAGEEQGGLF